MSPKLLTFVTAVRHPQNASSFSKVGALLEATLRSVCRQSDPDFSVIVVHNSLPEFKFSDERIHYLLVDFPPPTLERTAEIDFMAGIRDKGTKLSVGLAKARELGAEHVMFIDCDDLLHRDIARWVNERPRHPGWYSADGFIHTVGSAWVHPVIGDFHHRNGSTSIVRTDLAALSPLIRPGSSQAEVIEIMGTHYIERIIGIHGRWSELVREAGCEMEPLPFASTIWEIGTGENASGNLVSGRPRTRIGEEVTSDFGLERPGMAISAVQAGVMFCWRLARRARRITKRP